MYQVRRMSVRDLDDDLLDEKCGGGTLMIGS